MHNRMSPAHVCSPYRTMLPLVLAALMGCQAESDPAGSSEYESRPMEQSQAVTPRPVVDLDGNSVDLVETYVGRVNVLIFSRIREEGVSFTADTTVTKTQLINRNYKDL